MPTRGPERVLGALSIDRVHARCVLVFACVCVRECVRACVRAWARAMLTLHPAPGLRSWRGQAAPRTQVRVRGGAAGTTPAGLLDPNFTGFSGKFGVLY